MYIKKATVADVADISRIYAASWKVAFKGLVSQNYLDNLKDDHWVDAFTTWIAQSTFDINIIYDESTPVGGMVYGKSRDTVLKEYAEIASIYILPEYFGKGYGRALMESALADIKLQGYKDAYLWVLEGNNRAIEFYKKMGFLPTKDQLECYVDGELLIDYRYVYKIS